MLSSGTRLGTYEVTSHIGSGGMGDVYQAHDSKLGRDVAIKVLPEQFARDPERLARFQREAKMLAALNHPNIAAIYGLEESSGTHYLVMELVPGETLRERVAGGRPLPVEEALNIARQIAEALEAAHGSEKGIIHRDLKPANVKVTPEGRVKVLDFGLAKAFTSDTASDDPSNSPTLSALPTMQGVIMGTAAYMSPEQARGKIVTKATDIWAFGCVLYELLTSRQAFQGEDVTEILAAVMMKEPAFDALPPNTPAAIRTLLRRCLRKDRRQRLQDATDVRIEIEEALAAPSADPTTAPELRNRWQQAMVLGLAALAMAGITGLAVWKLKPTPETRPVSRFAVTLPPGEQLLGVDTGHPLVAISPDGTRLVYVVRRAGKTQLYLRALDSVEFTAIPRTEGALNPFFSPDSKWIGFFSEGKLKKVALAGGVPQILCDALNPNGATWGSDDTIVFSGGLARSLGLYRVSAAGGNPQSMTTPNMQKGETGHTWPAFLPNGKDVLFCVQRSNGGMDATQIVVQSLGTGTRQVLVEGGTYPQYVPTGHLAYLRAGTLMAAPFDLAELKVTGTSLPMVDGVMYSTPGAAQFSFSGLGGLVYLSGTLFGNLPGRLVWVDRKGAAQPLPAPVRGYNFPRLSPDGQRIVLQIVEAKIDIYVFDLARESLMRLTSEGQNTWPLWTPDGRRVTYTSDKGGHPNLFWKLADGSGTEERLATSEGSQSARSWSPDGQELVFDDVDPTKGAYKYIWVLPLQGDRKPRQTPFRGDHERLSPDGHWLAYQSQESGRYEVYVQPFPGPGGKWQISTDGGTEPVWNRNGRELFYRTFNKMMAVDVTTQPTFVPGKPRLLFESSAYMRVSDTPNYDVSLDGQQFLMIQASEPKSEPQLNVVLNWFEELKRRVPTSKQ